MSELIIINMPERFDFSTHGWFTKAYEEALRKTKKIVLDFSRVSYVDSSALGMMVLLHRQLSANSGHCAIRNIHGTAKDILDMANFEKLFSYE
ncbi:MAG: STAS domain-containing protein [Gammaproteobacteria bacterium]|jgi:HptB-dependent secretion and biofilm anti anti-sigma factor|uniref:Anti-anti-sigma factor n=1 Tax=Marinomonas polaris DSM 16579 TaxID=1122206 RepID=A0A1M5I9I1_9GAMM|nr:STAS domain-containing protein [Marinomonas polaris]MBU1294945.1 STAS domain-containing protein [Gammaproteobacteria bacterium]MBU1469031.1 STAS domain-containing protein [Gammaproteobacteria bacterium]MBU2022930.1 STAS domain-containing protein [Gammaproteobacteria bacterium]MBU2238175.1 STAS domain-containing protein [Gammaproteobacteria bacterium]MBU2320665.1 STAS domain-containing protein [Gammaproteobacteria bacterium]|tara:strand:+ start:25178 stop:25456 length:279 start_codon:yes stop_codon:yes gene_type:complete